MRNRLRGLHAALVATGLVFAGSAAFAEPREATSKAKAKAGQAVKAVDEDIKESILNARIRMVLLKSLKGADALRVSVSVHGTTATLSGEVEDRASEKVASEAAKSVEGVTAVRSSIRHNPKAPHQENFEAHVKDAILVSEVKLRLLQEVGGSAMGIHVTATDGVVSLRGEMPNEATHNRAVDNVKEIAGVLRVEDLMSTKP